MRKICVEIFKRTFKNSRHVIKLFFKCELRFIITIHDIRKKCNIRCTVTAHNKYFDK